MMLGGLVAEAQAKHAAGGALQRAALTPGCRSAADGSTAARLNWCALRSVCMLLYMLSMATTQRALCRCGPLWACCQRQPLLLLLLHAAHEHAQEVSLSDSPDASPVSDDNIEFGEQVSLSCTARSAAQSMQHGP
jgi:hypothetical protein